MCGTEFVTATSLKIHRLKCDKQKKMACEFCLDEFRSETSLKMHKLICIKKKPDEKNDLDKNNEDDSTNNSPSVFRRHDPIREFFEKEERLKKEKYQQQVKIRETNIVEEKPNNTINNIIEVLHQKNREMELKQQQQTHDASKTDQKEEVLAPVLSEKQNKFTDHVKEPVKTVLDENPKAVKESKIHQPMFQKEHKTKDQQDEPIIQKVNIKPTATESGAGSSKFKNVLPPKIDVEQAEHHWPKVQKLKIKLPKKPDVAQPIIRNPSDNVDPSTTR